MAFGIAEKSRNFGSLKITFRVVTLSFIFLVKIRFGSKLELSNDENNLLNFSSNIKKVLFFQLQRIPPSRRARSTSKQIRAVSTTVCEWCEAVQTLCCQDSPQQQGDPRCQPTLNILHTQPQPSGYRRIHRRPRHGYVPGMSYNFNFSNPNINLRESQIISV